MSRIRSIHPGIWTDEEFVSLSAAARLLFIGLWNECDDKGIFEWKPLTLKMRILPADNVDVVALLDEIAAAGCIVSYSVSGKNYGAVRNFCKFQRPKKPNDIHPVTPDILAFCGSSMSSSEPVGNQFGTGGEIAPQMEDGGGREGEVPPSPPAGGKGDFAFKGRVVRLNRQDFDDFRQRFHAIPDYPAELAAVDAWLADQPEAKQRKWFGSVAPWLNKRHQEALAANSPARCAPVVGI